MAVRRCRSCISCQSPLRVPCPLRRPATVTPLLWLQYYFRMKHDTIDIDVEQPELLIDLLKAAVKQAERDEMTSESVRIISAGRPVLDDLRDARSTH